MLCRCFLVGRLVALCIVICGPWQYKHKGRLSLEVGVDLNSIHGMIC
jgi:hypothetical protein